MKDSLASVMHECESVATGAGCKRDLCRFPRWLEPGVDCDGWCSAVDGAAQRDTHNVLKLVDWHLLQVGFWDYARYGIPITILTTAAGVVVLFVLR